MNAAYFCLEPPSFSTNYTQCIKRMEELNNLPGSHILKCENLSYRDFQQLQRNKQQQNEHIVGFPVNERYDVFLFVSGIKVGEKTK
jgi:hypothetical protein